MEYRGVKYLRKKLITKKTRIDTRYKYYEMKNVEIAEFYKMKNSTVNTIIQRATKKLRKELERYFNDTDK